MDATERRRGDHFVVLPDDIEAFRRDGYVHLEGVLSEDEVRELEVDYDRLLRREIAVPGKDYCDMAGGYGPAAEDFSIINVMLPRKYHPAWQGNVLERRAASIAAQLQGDGLVLDYDQLLAKRPLREDAVFAWHQDMAYWPATPDTRTATVWCAFDDATIDNGCMRFVRGSHKEPKLRPHAPVGRTREESHALGTTVDEAVDDIRYAEIRRGDVTVHDERVVHGSGPNCSQGWRRAYIVAFRSVETVATERRLGFTHSHNDEKDILDGVGIDGETR